MLPSLTLLLLRRDDFLALELQFVNLRLEGTPARLVRIDPAEAAFVIVWFPAQHLMEQAFWQGAEDIPGPVPVPVLALHAGPSRLVFMLPEDRDNLPLTLGSVLDWNALTPALAPNALPPGATAGPPPAEPNILQTAIEFPAGLVLSPDATGGWAHTVAPVTRNGRTELWHSRLGVRDEDPGGGHEVDESALPHLRAIWSTPLGVLFKSSLDDDKRAQIVRLSSDFSLQAHPPLPQGFNPQFVQVWKAELQQRGIPLTYTPRPIDAERFMLTGAGAWARLQSTWDYPTIIDEADERFTGYPQLTLEQWQHIAGGGRDQYVRTVERGFLCPTGNRASLVTITERQFVPVFLGSEGGVGIFGGQGVLRQFQFIVVQEPEQDYAAVASAFEHEGREMPLRRIRILTRETPKLDPPPPDSPRAYVPAVDGRPFPFEILAEDWEGQAVTLAMPLLFAYGDGIAKAAERYNDDAVTPPGWRQIATNGQRLAFAPTEEKTRGATTLTTSTLSFRAQEVTRPPRPPFLPEIVAAEANVPAVDQMLGTSQPTAVAFDTRYLNAGLGGAANKADLFLKLKDAPQRPFSPEKAGGLVAPNLGAGGLSRTLGPVSSPDKIATGEIDVADFAETRLLGGIKISDILTDANLTLGDFANATLPPDQLKDLLDDPHGRIKAPVLSTRQLSPELVETRFVWKPEIQSKNFGLLELKTQIGPPENPPPPAELVLDARMVNGPTPDASTSVVNGAFRRFALGFAGMLELTVQSLTFRAEPGKKLDVSADGVDLTFDGPLRFVNTLKDILPANGFSDPPALTVDADGVKAGYTLGVPSVGVGVFSIQNISLSAGLSLPFVDKPAGVRFAISERHKPFLVTVSLFGGGGFFGLALNASGIEQIEAAIEFGGNISLNLGIASGGVSVMAGVYFGMLNDSVKLTGYLRCGGFVEVLGIVSISVEFYLGFTYRQKGDAGGEVWGQASLKVCVKIAFISKSVMLTVERKFAGAAGDPTFADTVSLDDWAQYCAAFA